MRALACEMERRLQRHGERLDGLERQAHALQRQIEAALLHIAALIERQPGSKRSTRALDGSISGAAGSVAGPVSMVIIYHL
ncbi:hypothetical protein E3E12_00020 [Formicincola oecophyllae]|uniref:Uncharacterized protein n=1 Tax=Formicincola oecophyllae TaxID=2558361 RepID=A0A4Y6U8T0_9PROT|nr:hypothetical protein [Formicincola oecophyllae]QDH12856.1 hypothetical protein E3E12_00020 [Formicincola oecophyllae]